MENFVKRKFNFAEKITGEVRRIPLPRTPVNRARDVPSVRRWKPEYGP